MHEPAGTGHVTRKDDDEGDDRMSDNHALAQAVHDLGSAVWFGGSVMGVAGVNKAGEDLTNSLDRVRVANSAWSRFGPVEWVGIGATLIAGLRLAQVGKGRLALHQGFGRTGAIKAGVALAGAAATGYSAYCGMKIGKLTEEFQAQGRRVDVADATTPTSDTPPEIAKWQRRERVAQFAVPLLSGANIVLGSYLVQSYRTAATAKGVLHRVLPDRFAALPDKVAALPDKVASLPGAVGSLPGKVAVPAVVAAVSAKVGSHD
jgi:hypothetical protein